MRRIVVPELATIRSGVAESRSPMGWFAPSRSDGDNIDFTLVV